MVSGRRRNNYLGMITTKNVFFMRELHLELSTVLGDAEERRELKSISAPTSARV
jgi:hypothetical protein